MKKTQNEQVLEYMRKYGGITQRDAAQALGCYRLGARIWELKHAGHDIKTENVTYKNKDGRRVSFARYSLRTGGAA